MSTKSWKFLVCVSLICLNVSISLPIEAFFVSAKAMGMGTIGVAYPQDALATAFNPAGMAEIGDRFDIGLNELHDRGYGKIKGNLNPLANGQFKGMHKKDMFFPEFGINKSLPCGFSLGLAVFNQGYIKTTYNKPLAILGQTKVGLEYIDETINPTFAWKINSYHSIGVSLNIVFQRFKVNGIQNSAVPPLAFNPAHVTNRGYDYSSGVGFTVGWLWHLHKKLSFGISYQPKTYMRRFHKYNSFFADHGRFDIPSLIAVGIAYKPIEELVLSFDFQKINWRSIRSLRDGFFPTIFLHPLGDEKGPGFGWRNQTIYRLGIAYQASPELTLRLGYRHSRTPVKGSSTFANLLLLNLVENYVTAGASYLWNCSHDFSFFVAYGFQHEVHGTQVLPLQLGEGKVNIKEQKTLCGLAYGYEF